MDAVSVAAPPGGGRTSDSGSMCWLAIGVCAAVVVAAAFGFAFNSMLDGHHGILPLDKPGAVGTSAGECAVPGPTGVGHMRVACAGGWALVNWGRGGASTFELLHASRGRWVTRYSASSAELACAPERTGIGVPLLSRLGREFGATLAPEVSAAMILAKASKADDTSAGAGAWGASAVTERGGRLWLGVVPVARGLGGPQTLSIYRWTGSRWSVDGRVPAPLLDNSQGCPAIDAASLTGLPSPDFVFVSYGTDVGGESVVADLGGKWRLVPFEQEYGTGQGTQISGAEDVGRDIETEAGQGAFVIRTFLWEAYRDGAFRPAPPPGQPLDCSPATFESLVDPTASYDTGGQPAIVFTKAACLDGWALATGTGLGGRWVVGLFNEVSNFNTGMTNWQTVSLDDGSGLGFDAGDYDLPQPLLDELGARIGESVEPAIAVGDLGIALNGSADGPWGVQAAEPASSVWTLGGVVKGPSGSWVLGVDGSLQDPDVTVAVFHWSGHTWLRVGSIADIPENSDDIGPGLGVTLVSEPSGSPSFKLPGIGAAPSWTTVISEVHGTWRAAW